MVELINFLTETEELQLETLKWRNSPQVTKYFQIQNINAETHKKWLESLKIELPRTIAFFIKYNENLVGVTYFHSIDYGLGCADWGIYIYDESLRGKGVGKNALLKSIEYAHSIGLNKLYLEVLNHNDHAKKLYEKVGFVNLKQENNIIRMVKNI